MNHRLQHLFFVVVVAAVSSGCQTFESYGRVYPNSSDAVAGVEPYPSLLDRQKHTATRREQAVGVGVSRRLERCEILRGQLVHASREAAGHVGLVWGCPFIWPVDLVSLLLFPIGETQKAQAVWTQAELLERAYQSDTASFLSTCEQVQKTEVGRTFSQVLLPFTASKQRANAENSEPASTRTDDSGATENADEIGDVTPQ